MTHTNRKRISRVVFELAAGPWRVAAVLALTSASYGAIAQTMNYGALEQLFGEPVTTSVTGSPQRSSEVPANMEIITAEDIRRSGARDVTGALRNVIGVDLLQWGKDNTDVSVRGYDQPFASNLLVLINGRQVYADIYSLTPWNALPVELGAIRQIEVVKGPSSALFGFNAVGGVINIITYNPLYDDVNSLALTGGTQNLAQGSASTTFKIGDQAAFRMSAGARSDKDFTTPIPAAMDTGSRSANNRASIDLDGVFRLSDAAQVRIEASHTRAAQFEVNLGYVSEFSKFTTDSVKGEIMADTALGLLQGNAYVNEVDVRTTPGALGQGLEFDNRVSVLQLQDVFKIGAANLLRATLEYRHDTVNTSFVTGGQVGYKVFSASGMWEWKIAPAISFTNALRFDRLALERSGVIPPQYPFTDSNWDRFINETTFNSGLVWKLNALDTLRLTASRGALLPNLVELGALVAQTPGINISGIPTLNPTVVTNYEVDWDRLLPILHAQFRAAVFYQKTNSISDVVGGIIAAPTAISITPSNIGDSRAHGVEVSLKGNFAEAWRWGLGYRFESVKDHFEPAQQNGADFVDYQHTTPRDLINANLGWSKAKWEIDGYIRYQSSTQGLLPALGGQITVLTPIAAYASVDARVAYKLNARVTLAASGQDIAKSTQRQTSGPDVARQVFGTVTVDF
ncbi:MAG: outer rane receptor for ferrienterochelin and colicin [Gammaproteobacteria bacterium]|nr:outer rane receptor for ferrienterochelin and colicin [Gammaproteobacteria bacterium]